MKIELKIENIKRGTLLIFKSKKSKDKHTRLILKTNKKTITSLSAYKTQTNLRIKILKELKTQLDAMIHNNSHLYTLYKNPS